MNYRLSQFCHFIKNEAYPDLIAMYNSLSLGIVICDKVTAYLLMDCKNKTIPSEIFASFQEEKRGELLSILLQHKLIVSEENREDDIDYNKLQQGLNAKRIGVLYLLLSDACNMKCSYCLVENRLPIKKPTSLMPCETARAGIDLFCSLLNRSDGVVEPQIIFYGGEPFINPETMKFALKYIEKCKSNDLLPQNTYITINTNGTLIKEGMVDWLKSVNNLSIAISIDGPREINDSCRTYRTGGGTYGDIVRTHQLLLENGIEAGLCCTITRHNVDNLLDIAKWFSQKFGVKSLGFNLMIEGIDSKNETGSLYEYAEKAAKQLINCFLYFREKGIYEDRIMRKVNAFVEGTVYYYDCGGCGQQIVIAPNGRVGICQGYMSTGENFVDMDDKFDPLNHPLWGEWRKRSPLSMPQCRDCIALSLCGGGCPYSVEIRNGNIWELDRVFCQHAKMTVEFLVKDLIASASSKQDDGI